MAKSISIVTASLNHAPFIDDTIRSVLDQRYPNLEYIVIDGGNSHYVDDIRRANGPRRKRVLRGDFIAAASH